MQFTLFNAFRAFLSVILISSCGQFNLLEKELVALPTPNLSPVYCSDNMSSLSSADSETINYFKKNKFRISHFDQKQKLLAWIMLNMAMRPDIYSPKSNFEIVYFENKDLQNAKLILGNFKSVVKHLLGDLSNQKWKSFFKKAV